MSWADGKLVVFDFESTAPDPTVAKMVTCAIVVDEPGTEQIRHEFVAAVEVPDEAAAIHGYTTERAMAEGIPEREALRGVLDVLREHWTPTTPLVAFNACYDITLLDRRNIALNCGWPSGEIGQRGGPVIGPVVDPYVLDRTLGKRRRGKRKLNMVCDHYGVTLAEADAHTAIGDVLATLALTRTIARRIPRVRNTDLRQLYLDQQRMHAAWAVDMQAFIRGKKAEEKAPQDEIDAVIITGDWPIVPRPPVDDPALAVDAERTA